MYRLLQSVDPQTAARLSPRDRQRIGRALEVAELAGEPMSRIFSRPLESAPPLQESLRRLPVVALLRKRPDLCRRIEARCSEMLAAGLVEELRALLAAGLAPDAPGLRTVGYREFLPHLLSGAPLEECAGEFVCRSCQYSKRQETWMRHRLSERVEIWIEEKESAQTTAERVEAALLGPTLPA